jgi:hypothetical protein
MTHLPQPDVFAGRPGMWLDSQTESWVHQGHVDAETINRYLEVFALLDVITVVPSSIRHEWLKFTATETTDDDTSFRWEHATPSTKGAIPVTTATVTSDLIDVA